MKMYFPFYLIFLFLFASCGGGNDGSVDIEDKTPPQEVHTFPENEVSDVSVETAVSVKYDEDIVLDDNYQITINGKTAKASVLDMQLNIASVLDKNATYEINISNNSIKDIAGNYAEAVNFSFTTITTADDNTIYEAENATKSSGLNVENTISAYSGTGYVASFTNSSDYLTFSIPNITKGAYELYVGYSTSTWGTKKCMVNVNGSGGILELSASSNFSKVKYGNVKLLEGENTISITPNYTYFIIDYIQIIPSTDSETSFNIDADLVSPTPSVEAVKLYSFLKDNFQEKIISGTMANYNTNIDEAEWVYSQTGTWPALIGLDLIDYTRNWNWINYTELVDNAKTWWSNNGIISVMWHWRDPSKRTDEFYTEKTSFDISKISDVNSDEYKAILSDIDTIAVYLKSLETAGVPILWRPLHEAAGGWFWWGAKGSAHCQTLWKIMFDRLVTYHGLDNLIWIWTTDTNTDALDWYPGDEYVDIIGMDIYPGENQHGSQYAQFDKVKEMFNGKKIITLSECGSVPDPALMKEYGDTWSWFMPWNGEFTQSNTHNGVEWWQKFFSYNYVLTRDEMPDLK